MSRPIKGHETTMGTTRRSPKVLTKRQAPKMSCCFCPVFDPFLLLKAHHLAKRSQLARSAPQHAP